MSERLKESVLKTEVLIGIPGVRIPLHPRGHKFLHVYEAIKTSSTASTTSIPFQHATSTLYALDTYDDDCEGDLALSKARPLVIESRRHNRVPHRDCTFRILYPCLRVYVCVPPRAPSVPS